MASAVQQFDELLNADATAFVYVVYYRGHWCPFCMSWLRALEKLRPAIEAKRGAVIAVTAEPEKELAATRKTSGYAGTVIVDETHALAKALKQRGLVDVAVSSKGGYAEGMSQPAVLVLDKTKPADPLYSWAIVPSTMNVGGARDRPYLDQIWENVAAKLDGKPAKHASIKHLGFMGLLSEKVFG